MFLKEEGLFLRTPSCMYPEDSYEHEVCVKQGKIHPDNLLAKYPRFT